MCLNAGWKCSKNDQAMVESLFLASFLGSSLKSYAACRELLRQKISEIYLSPLEVQDVLHRLEDLTLDSSGQPVFNSSYILKKLFLLNLNLLKLSSLRLTMR